MIYKVVSSEQIIAKVARDFGLRESSWVGDAVEWIGEVIEDVGCSTPLQKKVAELEVKSHKVRIPCDLDVLDAVEYEGERLNYGGDLTGYALDVLDRTTDIYTDQGDGSLILSGTSQSLETLKNTGTFGSYKDDRNAPYYLLEPGWIKTSFSSGTIKLHYAGIPIDDKGFPMIPDHISFKNACSWKILTMTLASGHKHPVFNFADAEIRYEAYRDEAKVKVDFPSPDKMYSLLRNWKRLRLNEFLYDDFFAGLEHREKIQV